MGELPSAEVASDTFKGGSFREEVTRSTFGVPSPLDCSGASAGIDLSRETEALIQAKVARTGRTADEILREALVRTGDVLTWRNRADADIENFRNVAGLLALGDALARFLDLVGGEYRLAPHLGVKTRKCAGRQRDGEDKTNLRLAPVAPRPHSPAR
jgi:hypothetical protein